MKNDASKIFMVRIFKIVYETIVIISVRYFVLISVRF